MKKNESGFAGGVLGFYVGVMLGLALFRMPLPHEGMNAPEPKAGPASLHAHQSTDAARLPSILASPAAFGG